MTGFPAGAGPRRSGRPRPPQRLPSALLVALPVTGRGDDPPVPGIEIPVRRPEAHRTKSEGLGLGVPALPVADRREPVPEPRVAGLDLEGALQRRRRAAVLPDLLRLAGALEEGDDSGVPFPWQPFLRSRGRRWLGSPFNRRNPCRPWTGSVRRRRLPLGR